MARKCGAILDRLYGRIDCAAGVVTEYNNERRLQHFNCIFETRNHVVTGEIAGDATDENIAARHIETIFWTDP